MSGDDHGFEWPEEVPRDQPIPAVGWLRQVGLMAAKPTRHWRDRWKVYFDLRDWWIGLYVAHNGQHLYFIPAPTLVIRRCRPACTNHFQDQP